jgi:uncharacterized protein YqfA (UPF0365 family)
VGDKAVVFVVAAAVLLVSLGSLVAVALTFRVWVRGLLGGVRVSLPDVVGMRLRRTPAGLVVDALLTLKYRGVEASTAEVESAYIAHKGQPFTPTELADLVIQRK